MAIRRVRDLEIDEDLDFEAREARVGRVGVALMVAVVVAAALGLLGSGPLSRATARGDGVSVDYERVSRYQTSETLTVRLDAAARVPEIRLWVDRSYLEGARLESVVPPPVRVESAVDRLVMVFAVAEPERPPLSVTLTLQPERIGARHGRVGLDHRPGERAAAFRQLVFP